MIETCRLLYSNQLRNFELNTVCQCQYSLNHTHARACTHHVYVYVWKADVIYLGISEPAISRYLSKRVPFPDARGV